jgi:hypothetical protein
MASRYLSPRVPLGTSKSQRNLDAAKANIQMQKTGAKAIGYA